jgi:hypothetical protein
LAPRLDLFSRFSSWLDYLRINFPAATLTCGHLNRFCLDRTAYNRSAEVHQNALGRVRCVGHPLGPCEVFGKSAIMRPLRSITRPALALGCRAGKQSNDNGVRSGWRGCLRRCAGKSSSDGNLPKYAKSPTPISAMYSRFVLAPHSA